MKKLILFLALTLTSFLGAFPFDLQEVAEIKSSFSELMTTPNPIGLQPQWWEYYNVEGEELTKRIAQTNEQIQELYKNLSSEDKLIAYPLINEITTSLNALPHAKQQKAAQASFSLAQLKSYTLEKQLELNQNIRELKSDIQSEKLKLEQLKGRLTVAQKNIDNMMVSYLAQTQPTSKKLLDGLQIMAYRSNVGLGEHTARLEEKQIEEMTSKLNRYEEELLYSKQHLDTSKYDELELERNIALAQSELEYKQKELTTAEVNLLGVFNNPDRDAQMRLEQQVVQASVSKAYAWAKLSFNRFKYNLVMHLNNRFQDGYEELRPVLNDWREIIQGVLQDASAWRKSALKDQDHIRQEFAFLIAQNEPGHSADMRANKALQQGIGNILTTIELLEEEIVNTNWLIVLLEDNFKANHTIWENWWSGAMDQLMRGWTSIVYALNYSLFKVSGIPITLFTIFKILLIVSLSFWLSMVIRSSLVNLGKNRKDIPESTLYSLGSLAHYFVLLFGFIIALCSIGLDFGNFVFIAGAMMFGISFGLQSLANNFFCGLRILFERKLKIGDDIELHSGHSGKVSEIHVQNTVVKTSDGQKVIIPNAELIGNTLVNWTRHHHDYRRLHIPFAVAANCDKDLVRDIVIEAAKRVPCVLGSHQGYHDPQVWLVNFGSHALEFKLVVWVDYKQDTYSDSKEADFLWEIESSLRSHQIALPHVHPLMFHLKPS